MNIVNMSCDAHSVSKTKLQPWEDVHVRAPLIQTYEKGDFSDPAIRQIVHHVRF